MSARIPSCLAALFCTLLASGAHAQMEPGEGVSAAQVAAVEKSEAIMQRAQQQKGLLAQYQVMRHAYANNGNATFRVIFGQYLSWYQTFIGDDQDALQSFAIKEKSLPDDAPSPLGQPGWHAVPALTYLPQLAKSYRAVFLNEAHNVPLTRSLTVQLLKALRQEGFNYFAAETLYHSDGDLQKRGYPVAASGFYIREPVYAEMVRTALKLGYKVVAYEADDNHTGDAREAQQAQNLARILKDDPTARLVVNAGYAHIQKSGQFLGAQSMAEHFQKLSGIEPLAVEQTMLISHGNTYMDHPYYAGLAEALQSGQPGVFVDSAGKPWSLRPGYDVSVVFPETRVRDSRPTWLTLGALREPYNVDGNLCQDRYPCLIEARYADEGNDAIPADRLVLDIIPLMMTGDIKVTTSNAALPVGELYLRPGPYRLTAVDENGHILYSARINVGKSAALAGTGTGREGGHDPACAQDGGAAPSSRACTQQGGVRE